MCYRTPQNRLHARTKKTLKPPISSKMVRTTGCRSAKAASNTRPKLATSRLFRARLPETGIMPAFQRQAAVAMRQPGEGRQIQPATLMVVLQTLC
ncbi:hypothetical protein F4W67_22035 [Pseudomonas caricapapayae]|nr:hypothetical protein F4W67_22035 [Pseudomonas caricapapayae]